MAEKLGLWNYPPFIGQQGPGVARMMWSTVTEAKSQFTLAQWVTKCISTRRFGVKVAPQAANEYSDNQTGTCMYGEHSDSSPPEDFKICVCRGISTGSIQARMPQPWS